MVRPKRLIIRGDAGASAVLSLPAMNELILGGARSGKSTLAEQRALTSGLRVIYVATLPETVVVLHCFRKTTQQTAKADIDLAARRLRDLKR